MKQMTGTRSFDRCCSLRKNTFANLDVIDVVTSLLGIPCYMCRMSESSETYSRFLIARVL